ncbi:OmpA family protein [Formosa sp. PL04]|uniref:OmpA family protein n=1 Tax=Formosa sp. PL04 TaxID=3081755 RepID=UPI002982351D|nr:OmpA family protein [Formosa sp. PL04]MDW5288168.1 OmpA family protein [Formosa sp. PL04]
MDDNLLKSLSNYITPDLITQASETLGESETGVFNAISISIPTLLNGLLNNVNDTTVIDNVINLANHKNFDASATLSSLPTLLTDKRNESTLEAGTSMLNLLFGSQQSKLFDILGNESGVKKTSISRLLLMAAPLFLAYIRKSGYDSSRLIKTLNAEKDDIQKNVPTGLNALFAKNKMLKTEVKAKIKTPKKKSVESAKPRWILPFLIFVAALLLFYLMREGDGEPNMPIIPEHIPTTLQEPIEPLIKDTKTKITLPNGTTFKVYNLGLESSLSTWLANPENVIDKNTLFDFDGLLFPVAEAKLLPESQVQLKNLVDILNAYPNTTIRIEGYTDNTRDPDFNLKLSEDRAQNVVTEIIVMGIDPKRLSAEGYGEQHPVATNDTEEGQAQNRRIVMRVTNK